MEYLTNLKNTAVKEKVVHLIPQPEQVSMPTVLVVDDQRTLLKALEFCLISGGYRVVTADNGQSGLKIMGDISPDLIISDISMPEMDGFDFFQTVRSDARWVEIPFIFLTANGEAEDIRYGKLLGAEEYLVKPFNPKDIQAVVEAKLRRARQLQRHSRQSLDRFKTQLVETLSHEFKTPLFQITLASDLLARHGANIAPEALQDIVESIQRGGHRLTGLTEDILTIVAIDGGVSHQAYETTKEPYSLGLSLLRAADICREKAERRNIDLDIASPPNDLYVDGVERQLTVALTKILDNAIKFSPEGGQVSVKIDKTDWDVAISFQDEGRGIPETELPRLFDRFYQVNREVQEQQGGGLGLSIAQAYVTLHQGCISVRSREDVGTTFIVRLPLYNQ